VAVSALLCTNVHRLRPVVQQNRYYAMLERSHPVMEADYAYNPPARLAALLICGPAILVPIGAHVYDPSIRSWIFSVIAVSIFWFWFGWMIDRKAEGRSPIIKSDLRRVSLYFTFLVQLGFLGWKVADQVRSVMGDPYLPAYVEEYGLSAVTLLDVGAGLWILAAIGFCSWQILASIQRTLPSRRRLS
jgi:hypothetical protein